LKVLASHGSGRATLASLKRDIAILATSGPDWNARIKRLASRVPVIDIFGNGHVLRDDDGWQITPSGLEFLRALEAVTQDNRPLEIEQLLSRDADVAERGGERSGQRAVDQVRSSAIPGSPFSIARR
jgi:hypothetical protein